jgi:hypothetical protein
MFLPTAETDRQRRPVSKRALRRSFLFSGNDEGCLQRLLVSPARQPRLHMFQSLDFARRAKAAAVHLLISLLVGLLAAGLVFGIWYPGVYRFLAGGRDLFWLVMAVDVVLGPLLTFAVFNLKKGWFHLRRDLTVIGSLQMAALIFGLMTVYAARPVALVFEVDRFRVVTAALVNTPELPKARPEYRQLPLSGPWLLGTRAPKDGAESNDALTTALQTGIDRAQRPQFWQPYADSIPDVLRRARPLSVLLARYPTLKPQVADALKDAEVNEASARFLPVMARGGDWVVVLDAKARLIHYALADGFF